MSAAMALFLTIVVGLLAAQYPDAFASVVVALIALRRWSRR